MGDPAEKLESEALKLSPGERARLAERLISSLDPETDSDVDEAWRQEAERRLDEIESDSVSAIPLDQSIEKARSTLR